VLDGTGIADQIPAGNEDGCRSVRIKGGCPHGKAVFIMIAEKAVVGGRCAVDGYGGPSIEAGRIHGIKGNAYRSSGPADAGARRDIADNGRRFVYSQFVRIVGCAYVAQDIARGESERRIPLGCRCCDRKGVGVNLVVIAHICNARIRGGHPVDGKGGQAVKRTDVINIGCDNRCLSQADEIRRCGDRAEDGGIGVIGKFGRVEKIKRVAREVDRKYGNLRGTFHGRRR